MGLTQVRFAMILLAIKNRMTAVAPPHLLVAQKLGTFILNVFDFASLQTSFERVMEISSTED